MAEQTVCVVDDDESVRESLHELLDAAGYRVEAFGRATDFLGCDAANHCSCLVTDIRMPEMDGLALQEELNRRGSNFPVIVITGHGDVPLAVRAMKAGASDFIEKPFKQQTLLDAVGRALTRKAQRPAEADASVRKRADALTEREREVLDLMVMGHPNKVIAQKLDISFRTVEVHRARVLAKMEVSNVAELVRLMMGSGL